METNLTLYLALLAAGSASAVIVLHALADVLMRRRPLDTEAAVQD